MWVRGSAHVVERVAHVVERVGKVAERVVKVLPPSRPNVREQEGRHLDKRVGHLGREGRERVVKD